MCIIHADIMYICIHV